MTKDQKLIKIACKEFLMNIVKESEILNEKLSFFQKTLLYDAIREMSYDEVLSVLINDGKKVTTEQKREFESNAKKAAKYGAVAGAGAYLVKRRIPTKAYRTAKLVAKHPKKGTKKVVGAIKKTKPYKLAKWFMQSPGELKHFRLQKGGTRAAIKGIIAGVGALYLFRKLSDPCVRKNIGNKKAQYECKLAAIKKIISEIKADLDKCSATSDPEKCRKKVGKEIIKWQTKYQQMLVKVNELKGKKAS